MVAIANAETTVVVEKTVGEAMSLLRHIGANAVAVRYEGDSEAPTGIGFELRTEHGLRQFELPVQIGGVLAVLKREKVAARFQTRAQAERVAWRIAKDWLCAQAALIDAHQATAVQVMLPYMVTDRDDDGAAVTVYDRYVAQAGTLALEGS